MSKQSTFLKRVRKYHTCYSLGFKRDDMCDKCKYFKDKADGLAGRRPKKDALPKCEKIWFKACNDKINVHTVNTKNHFIKLLEQYGYKVSHDIVEMEGGKRLYGVYVNPRKEDENTTKKLKPTVQDKLSKTSINVSTSETLNEIHPNLMCTEGLNDTQDRSNLMWSNNSKSSLIVNIFQKNYVTNWNLSLKKYQTTIQLKR